jgi:hypothetical protein
LVRDHPIPRLLPTRNNTDRGETHTTMARVGFEPTIPGFERAKTSYALDRAATLIGPLRFMIRTSKVWSGNKICLSIFKRIVLTRISECYLEAPLTSANINSGDRLHLD